MTTHNHPPRNASRLRPPEPLPRLYRWRTNLIQAPIFLASTSLFGSLALLASLFDRSGRAQHAIARLWARASLFSSGARLIIRGEENLRRHPVAVFAANHTSYMDTPVVFSALPFQFRILAKAELWKMPFIGWYLNRSGQIPIDTTSAHTTLSSLGAGVKALRGGMPLFVFPEGSRTPDGAMQSFLSGAAFLAIRAQVPLVPIALSGVYDLLPIHTRHFFPGPLTLTVGQPISTTGIKLSQADELTQRLRTAILDLQSSRVTLVANTADSVA
ncbi:MAG TPA: lysophospholipid acyltransferase family protein [Terracidiphilus sp.]|nr:lysophospholipid acyltransferase family protein [Terracidiphilus sp.]